MSLLLLVSSCKDTSINFKEVPLDPPMEIQYKINLQGDKYIKDTDTLKIEIIDTSLVNTYYMKDFAILLGKITPSLLNTDNPVTAFIDNVTFEVNPNNNYELWVYGFEANLDSTRQKHIGIYLNYILHLDFSTFKFNYIDKEIAFNVVSTKE